MREGKELVLATKPFAQDQRRRSWWHFGSTLVVLAGLLGMTCLDIPWFARLPFSILAGLVLIRMFVIYHDYLHGSILSDSWLATCFFRVYGLVVLTPASVWRHTHDHHHHHNGQYFGTGIGNFNLMTTVDYARAGRWQRLHYVVERHPATILLGYVTVFFFSHCVVHFLAKPWRHVDAAVSILVHAAVVTGLALLAPGILVFSLLIPLALAAAIGAYLFYAQHNFPGVRFQDTDHWDYVAAALYSSSYLRMNPFMHWVTGNIGYHHVHHLNARIPFYRLPEAMAAIEELQSPGTTSLHPFDVYRCLRLKLWDPARKRLVTFSECKRTSPSCAGT